MLIRALAVARTNTKCRAILKHLDEREDVAASALTKGTTVWEAFGREPVDLVAIDVNAIEGEFAAFIGDIRGLPDAPEVVVFVEKATPELRAELQAAEAFAVIDITVGFEEARDALDGVVARLVEKVNSDYLARQSRELGSLSDFASLSPRMQQFISFVRRVVDTDSTLLVLGETGVGKEYLARAIHAESPRFDAPFVPVNCSALSTSLLESELFGHVEGAFTGASRGRRGFFEMAHGGTLFLDEVGDLEPSVQVKLLRVLQDKRVQPVGSEREMEVDVRVIAATNRSLGEAVEEGRFRSDLYYRLSVVKLEVPPLRERVEDIAGLFQSNVERFRTSIGRPVRGATEKALALLLAYPWPGNVRELANVAERAVLLCQDPEIGPMDLPAELRGIGAPVGMAALSKRLPAADPPLAPISPPQPLKLKPFKGARDEVIDSFEIEYFTALLTECRGHIQDAAKRSGLHSRSLYDKLQRLGLRKEDFRL